MRLIVEVEVKVPERVCVGVCVPVGVCVEGCVTRLVGVPDFVPV